MRGNDGMSLVELIATVAILGIALGMAALYFRPMGTALGNGVSLTESFLREARASALATTSAFRVRPSGPLALSAETAASCEESTWAPVADMSVELPRDVVLSDTSWTVCFSARGISDGNVVVGLWHPESGVRRIEVLRGGTTRILP